MSYQNEEGLRVEAQEETDVQVNARNWNAVLVATGLGMAGVLAVSASGLATPMFRSTNMAENAPVAAATYVPQYDALTETQLASLFDGFKTKFGKSYATEDESSNRFENFKNFLSNVDVRNSAEGDELHGITKFADLTEEEFKQTYLGFQMTETQRKSVAARKAAFASARKSASVDAQAPKKPVVSAATDDASVVNWYMVSTTAVKNQGYCGSCWAFSATEQLESAAIQQGILTTSDALSPQQIVSCAAESDGCYGCDGGDPIGAYEYIQSAGGLESQSDYPYESYYGESETCSTDSSDYEVTVTDYTVLDNEDDMISYVSSTGPLSVCVDASTWSSYSKGVVSVCGKEVDHCVQAVGINNEAGYWIVRNSWGTDWGESGFIYLKSGQNTCDISYLPSYVSAEAV